MVVARSKRLHLLGRWQDWPYFEPVLVVHDPVVAAVDEQRRHGDPGEELLGELENASHQVFLARKFYNDAVAVTQAARQRWLAVVFRLAGRAPYPEFFEIDDALVPAGESAGPGADLPHLTAS